MFIFKRTITHIVLTLFLLVITCGAKEKHFNTTTSKNYFPLKIGNSWEYIETSTDRFSRIKKVVGDTLLANGSTYFKVKAFYPANSIVSTIILDLLRKDTLGNVFIFENNQEHILYDFSKNINETYPAHWKGFYWQIKEKSQVHFWGSLYSKVTIALMDSLNKLHNSIAFVESYGLTDYEGYQGREKQDYKSAELWGAVISGKTERELVATHSKPDWQKYYPLAVGDKWIYKYSSSFIDTVTIEVKKDTTFSDGQTYKKLLRSYKLIQFHNNDCYFERADKMGNVYRIDANGTELQHPFISFSMRVGDTIPHYRNANEIRRLDNKLYDYWPVLGSNAYSLYYTAPNSVTTERAHFVKNIGLVHEVLEGSSRELISAYVNGKMYGDSNIVTSFKRDILPVQYDYKLNNWPNPFNGSTSIRFNLPKKAKVTLNIYNMLGKKMARLLENYVLSKGPHRIIWFGTEAAASGTYIINMMVDGVAVENKRIVLIK